MSTGTALRVGADVVSVQQVEESVARFGSRYLERIYTRHELESSVGRSPVRAASLAARRREGSHAQGVAASGASTRLAVSGGASPPKRLVHHGLSGHAAVLADQAGIAELAVSLTHEGDVAAAVVVALCGPGSDSLEQAEMSR